MSNNPEAFLATVIYTDHDGALHTMGALVLAVDLDDAMAAAIEAVSSLPDCARVDGGMIEPAPEPASAPNARGLTPPTVPPSRTVH